MALLLGCQEIAKGYSGKRLFDGLTLAVHDGDRIGLVGPNGAGKTTLLRILTGDEEPDDGTVTLRRGARRAIVPQAPSFRPGLTVHDTLVEALGPDVHDGERTKRIGQVVGRCGLEDPSLPVEVLSGGWRRRLAIACALIQEPDLLLLDEPTNHLDLDGVLWLEELLVGGRFASVVVSHDRYLLERFASRMIEVSPLLPGGSFAVDGRYSDLLAKKEAFLAAESRREDGLRSRMRRELEWLRRGPKARTTKSKARIDGAARLGSEIADLAGRRVQRRAGIEFDATGRRTRRLLVCEGLTLRRGGRTLFRDLDVVLGPGQRIGLLGPNGCGKTSLLRVLLGQLKPDGGTVRRADALRVVFFDQHREGLDPALSLRRALAPEGDVVQFRGDGIHVASWARRFLFPADRLDVRVGMLSGGEVARVHIARLMREPADLLLLDEPTNDLDIDTLEVLEESLLSFAGAVVLVTHDRYLLERLTHRILGMDGEGNVELYADLAQYQDAVRERAQGRTTRAVESAAPRPASAREGRKRLTYRERQEWDGLPAAIEKAEAVQIEQERILTDPAVAKYHERAHAGYRALEQTKAEVDQQYERWAELEDKMTAPG